MRTVEDIERYLGMTAPGYEKVGEGTWVVRLQPGNVPLVVRYDPPVVVFQMKILPLPTKDREAFMAMLLRFNATDVVHGAYGLDGNDVVLDCALQVENLDLNEFNAAIDSFEIVWDQHREQLARFQH